MAGDAIHCAARARRAARASTHNPPCSLLLHQGLETAPLLVEDGPLPTFRDYDKGYQTIDMMAPARDFGSANPVLKRSRAAGGASS